MNVSIKKIRGKEYLYLEDYVKVSGKSKKISIYLGKYPLDREKSEQLFMEKLQKLELKKREIFLSQTSGKFQLLHLIPSEIENLEKMRFNLRRYRDVYPQEAKKYQDTIYTRYAQGSTAIEGNTLNLREAHLLMNEGITPEGKSLREVYELINFIKLRDYLENFDGRLGERLIKKIHSILVENILDAPGEYRRTMVLIQGVEYEPPPAFEVPELMKELFIWYNLNKKTLYPLELAGILHAKFENIHPFPDGNGRLGRALINFILESQEYPTVYLGLEHRKVYIDAMEEGNKERYKDLVSLLYRVTMETHKKLLDDFKPESKENVLRKYSKLIDKACGK